MITKLVKRMVPGEVPEARSDLGRCWLWTGQLNAKGYARLSGYSVHRTMYEIVVGKIPPGLTIDHLCRVKNCVRPRHMEVVTREENSHRNLGFKPQCSQGHDYTEENTYWYRGNRSCRTCRNERSAAYKTRRAA